ncbi:hypothetical protein PspLS_05502 [Pyricularia sp. CBS 133598]|nr:hypothetical protein PspLS_05502 [Pyricularia sp. CBS 133598]
MEKGRDGVNGIPLMGAHDEIERSQSRTPGGHTRTTSYQSRELAEDFSYLTATETATRLQTSLTHGLTATEALRRQQVHGLNEIPHEPPEPLWLRFIGQFKEPLILLLLASAAASIFLGNTDDAVSITVAVTIVVTVGFVQEYRSEKSIEALSHLVPDHAHLIRNSATKPAQSRSTTWPANNGQVEDDAPEPTASGATTPGEAALEATSVKVMAEQLVPGDLVIFTTGDRIPADIRVTKATDLTIDASNLTGENEPERLTAAPRPRGARPLSPYVGSSLQLPSPTFAAPSAPDFKSQAGDDMNQEPKNVAYMGTLVRSGHGQGIVFATGGNTHFGTISLSVSGTESPRSPLQLSMDELGGQLSKFSFVVIGFISLIGFLQGKKLLEIFTISISLAVAAIPEGLPIIVTVTLALGVHRMAKRNAIVRKMPKVETLGSVNIVCTDKTGTLTMNHMTTTKMWYFGQQSSVSVDSDDEFTEIKPDAATLRILRIGNIANNARLAHQYTENGAAARAVLSSTLGKNEHSSTYTRWVGQPTDVAMLDLLDRFKEHDARGSVGPRTTETPFSSERKWMGVTIGAEGGSRNDKEFAYIKGAIDRVLASCDTYITGEGREFVLDSNRRQEAIQAAEQMAAKGLRVLAFASGAVSKPTRGKGPMASTTRSSTPAGNNSEDGHPATNEEPYTGLTFAGLVGMSDPPRPGVARSIRKLMRGGVKVIMITGDAETTAVAIGRQLGMHIAAPIEHGDNQVSVRPVLRGEEVDAMTEEELAQAMQTTTVFARTNPDHKMKIIRALQMRGDIVAMTGDGVNDAPALKKADIGIAMGRQGTDVAKEAADMILTDDDFSTILHAIEEGKGIFNNIQNFLTFQLSTSAAGLSLVLLCTALGFKSPLNAMQILWINIIMDGPPAQSLGVEAVDKDVMNRPPRKRNDPVLTRAVIQRVAQSATIVMVGTMLVYTHEMLEDRQVTRRDTTMTFTCFVLFDMFNALACRSESKSILRGEIGLFQNTLFNWAVSLSIAGQLLVIYFPWLQEVFQTEALGLMDLVNVPSARRTAHESRIAGRYEPTLHKTAQMSALSNGHATASSSSAKLPPATAGGDAAAADAGLGLKKELSSTKGNTSAMVAEMIRPIQEASSVADIRTALEALHAREQALTSRLDGLVSSHSDLSRDLLRLDNLRATLGAQVIASRTISNTMLSGAADTAERLSSRVRTLDLEKDRVQATLNVVEQVAELKACVAGVVGSMGAPQDWEAAAGYLARAAAVPDEILHCGFARAVVPTVETPDSPAATLESARESLCSLFLREFDKAASEGDEAKVTRFFKLFPLIGRGDVGLDIYGRFVCQGVAGMARQTLRDGPGVTAAGGQQQNTFFFAGALTKLFEHVARIIEGHGGLVERHYGAGKMVRVIERLQVEVDVQGGIVLDSWSDDRTVDRRLKDVKSYPFSFLVQSFLPQQRGGFGGTPRVNSPAGGVGTNDSRQSEDEGVNMKEVDGLLAEIAVMLGKWSFYMRFLAVKCRDNSTPEDSPLVTPPVIRNSNLYRKVNGKLIIPYNVMSTFYFRRSVEKAFQLDESPTGLSLTMGKSMDGNPPYIISAVDDVMYIVSSVLQRTLSTSQIEVITSVVPTIGRVLGSDFVGMIQRRMRDETYPVPAVKGGFPPEDKIIAFTVLCNSLDMAKEYLTRIISSRLGPPDAPESLNGSAAPRPPAGGLKGIFPLERDASVVTRELQSLEAAFSSKAGDLLKEGIEVLFGQVVRPRLRVALSETFRDADYGLTEENLAEAAARNDEDEADLVERLEAVGRVFEHRWDALMQPLARLQTPRTYASLLELAARHLAKVLERRAWAAVGKVSGYGIVRMERDFSAMIGAVARGNYALREEFARVSQVLMVANMEEDEWDELVAEESAGEGGGMQWVLSEEERRKARTIVGLL